MSETSLGRGAGGAASAGPLIFVAPNGARRTAEDHPAVPLSVGQIVETGRACFAAGAHGLHAHVRDAQGRHVLNAGLYRELLDEMARLVPEMDVQITSEAAGAYSPAQQREVVRAVRPKHVSVALREMFADDDLAAVSRFYFEMSEGGTQIQHIVYTPEEFSRLVKLMMAGMLPARQKSVLFVLGQYGSGRQGTPDMLGPFLAELKSLRLAEQWTFMACAFGRGETECLVAAARAGGNCRVGFENNLEHADGTIARDNAERVVALKRALEASGIAGSA